jgi:hypothetical protein
MHSFAAKRMKYIATVLATAVLAAIATEAHATSVVSLSLSRTAAQCNNTGLSPTELFITRQSALLNYLASLGWKITPFGQSILAGSVPPSAVVTTPVGKEISGIDAIAVGGAKMPSHLEAQRVVNAAIEIHATRSVARIANPVSPDPQLVCDPGETGNVSYYVDAGQYSQSEWTVKTTNNSETEYSDVDQCGVSGPCEMTDDWETTSPWYVAAVNVYASPDATLSEWWCS